MCNRQGQNQGDEDTLDGSVGSTTLYFDEEGKLKSVETEYSNRFESIESDGRTLIFRDSSDDDEEPEIVIW